MAPATHAELNDAHATHAELAALAAANDAHLRAFVRANDRIFLDPQMVDVRAGLVKQLESYLCKARPEASTLADIERALRTGVIQGAALGDDSDFDELEEDLAENWREDPCDAWAATLASVASHAGGCVITYDGRCVGPLPIPEWLSAHMPAALASLKRHVRPEDGAAMLKSTQALLAALGGRIAHELQGSEPSTSTLSELVPRLLLTLHFMGEHPEAWAADGRLNALGAASRAAGLLASAGHEEEAQAGLLAEVQTLAWIASLLVEQDAAIARKGADALEEEGAADWTGDDEGPEQHGAALLHLAVTLVEQAAEGQ